MATPTCFNNLDIGKEYICPKSTKAKAARQNPSPSQWFSAQSAKLNKTCYGAYGQQLGRNPACNRQSGGAPVVIPEIYAPPQFTYTTTGDLVKGNLCQVGGGNGSGDTASCVKTSPNTYSEDPADSPGYALQLDSPFVGGRPVSASHNNTTPRKVAPKRHNLNRGFECRQPYWQKKCM